MQNGFNRDAIVENPCAENPISKAFRVPFGLDLAMKLLLSGDGLRQLFELGWLTRNRGAPSSFEIGANHKT